MIYYKAATHLLSVDQTKRIVNRLKVLFDTTNTRENMPKRVFERIDFHMKLLKKFR